VITPDVPQPRVVMSPDGFKLATYEWGTEDQPTVVLVHGFASSALLNWHSSGWVRDLVRAGYRVVAHDQRGHGHSDKPHSPTEYTIEKLVDDLAAVLDTYMIDDAHYVGYSLGARVGWQAALDLPHLIGRAVLGGIPDGDPLTRFDIGQARAFIEHGTPVEDRLTGAYVTMASGIRGNDLEALVSLVEGMRGGTQPDPANPPQQPILFATGSDDSIIEKSRRLAEAAPNATFFEIPGRNHFNAPVSRQFKDAALAFVEQA
jgi:pimeloyl-ACP methyl ester carboxylesterase